MSSVSFEATNVDETDEVDGALAEVGDNEGELTMVSDRS